MIDNLRTELTLRVATTGADAVLAKMGYRRVTDRLRKRLESVLASEDLGLDQSHFDFRFNGLEFLRALCAAAELEPAYYEAKILEIETMVAEDRRAFRPYLWVDTHFRRKSQPIFALALSEPQRYVDFPARFWRLPPEKQLSMAQGKVRWHMTETGGELGIWGSICGYFFFYSENNAYELDTEGNVIAHHEGIRPGSRAEHPAAPALGAGKQTG